MKLSTRDAAGFLKKPRPDTALILLYGPEPMRTALTRQDLLKTLLGENAEEDMRLTRMTPRELSSEPASLQDALKAIGFFPGARGVLITDANDSIAGVVTDALPTWEHGDAVIVIEAGNLTKGSKLRKLAESAPNAAAIALYPDPPSRASVDEALARAGIGNASNDAKSALFQIAASVDPGDFRQLIEKIAVYLGSGAEELTLEDVTACAPATTEEGIDTVINALADGEVAAIGPSMQRLAAQGTNPTTLCIAASRHFRALHTAASDPRGPDSGMSALRPPIFGPRRDRMIRQARNWGMYKLETALKTLVETDLQLRSSSAHPSMAVLERAFIRISMQARPR
jgi:DNA polymerase-3 subunit delta